LKGGNRVDAKEKSSKEKISEEKEALRPSAGHDSEIPSESQSLTSTREENSISSPGFFFCHPEPR
jgi:hypothetical protein